MEQQLFILNKAFNKEKIDQLLKKIKIQQISCGYLHIALLDDQNNIYECGENKFGQLGLGHYDDTDYFVKVNELCNNVKFISAGGHSTIIVTLQNEVFGTGNIFDFYSQKKFTKIETLPTKFIIKNIKSVNGTTLILNNKNELFGAGQNNFNQLGFKDQSKKLLKFEKLNLPKEIKEIKEFGCGSRYTAVLTKENSVYIVGNQYKTFTKLKLSNYKQLGCLFDNLYLLSTDNKIHLFDFHFGIANVIDCHFEKTVKTIFSGFGYNLYFVTNENELYYLDSLAYRFNEGQIFVKMSIMDWKFPYLYVYPANFFTVVLNSNYCLDGMESKEIKAMKGILFKRVNTIPFMDVVIYF